MFLYSLLVAFFVLLCLFMIIIILIQRGKGSAGIGNLGGGTQLLFGGSGGADIFQKATWIMGMLFMGISLILALMKSVSSETSKYAATNFSSTEISQSEEPGQVEPVSDKN